MATKKSILKSVVGLIPQQQVQTENVTQIPPYPDAGVEFKGYYKVPIGGNQYILKRQSQRNYYLKFLMTNGKHGITRTNPTTHRFCLKKIHIMLGDSAISTETLMQILFYSTNSASDAGVTFFTWTRCKHANIIDPPRDIIIEFAAPIIISESIIQATISDTMSSSEQIAINYLGWDEEI